MKSDRKIYNMKKEQSELIQIFFLDKTLLYNEVYLSKAHSNLFKKMVEEFVGAKLPYTKINKTVYNYSDSIVLQNTKYKILNGSEIKFDFNK